MSVVGIGVAGSRTLRVPRTFGIDVLRVVSAVQFHATMMMSAAVLPQAPESLSSRADGQGTGGGSVASVASGLCGNVSHADPPTVGDEAAAGAVPKDCATGGNGASSVDRMSSMGSTASESPSPEEPLPRNLCAHHSSVSTTADEASNGSESSPRPSTVWSSVLSGSGDQPSRSSAHPSVRPEGLSSSAHLATLPNSSSYVRDESAVSAFSDPISKDGSLPEPRSLPESSVTGAAEGLPNASPRVSSNVPERLSGSVDSAVSAVSGAASAATQLLSGGTASVPSPQQSGGSSEVVVVANSGSGGDSSSSSPAAESPDASPRSSTDGSPEGIVTFSQPKRGRGRPRKYPLDPNAGTSPQSAAGVSTGPQKAGEPSCSASDVANSTSMGLGGSLRAQSQKKKRANAAREGSSDEDSTSETSAPARSGKPQYSTCVIWRPFWELVGNLLGTSAKLTRFLLFDGRY